jgi:hypothetical protein
MRCQVCDVVLTDFESTRKHAVTGEYLDTCNKCLDEIAVIPTIDREDLRDVVESELDLDVNRLESDCY